jgi:hypothetical protein
VEQVMETQNIIGSIADDSLDDEQKRRLRAVRRGYRAESVEVKDNGWCIEIKYMDGSTVSVNSKMVKLKASALSENR